MKGLLVVTLLVLASVAMGQNVHEMLSKYSPEELATDVWVVGAAGSSGYSNYRHQADVCHFYQVAHKYGVPDEHIIIFMYDDIANSASNPRKGEIINEPNGADVYKGVPHDYTGKDVSAANFMKVMRGEEMTVGSGKTLKSTKDSHVLVFFSDHGSTSAICFPEGCTIGREKMQDTLQASYKNGLYKELIFYVEACYAGAVFYKLDMPPGAYVVTASPVGASSFAYNWDDTIHAYVADIFSYLFIHDLEFAPESETFQAQYEMITNSIENYSQACQYGDKTIAKSETLGSFLKPKTFSRNNLDMYRRSRPVITDAVSAFDVPLETARRIYASNPTVANLATLRREQALREHVDGKVARIVASATPTSPHLATPPCITCDKTCNCMKYCGTTARCQFECCNEQSCYEDPPKVDGFAVNADAILECSELLSSAFLEACGNSNDYYRSADILFHRACKSPDVDIPAALAAIRAEC